MIVIFLHYPRGGSPQKCRKYTTDFHGAFLLLVAQRDAVVYKIKRACFFFFSKVESIIDRHQSRTIYSVKKRPRL